MLQKSSKQAELMIQKCFGKILVNPGIKHPSIKISLNILYTGHFKNKHYICIDVKLYTGRMLGVYKPHMSAHCTYHISHHLYWSDYLFAKNLSTATHIFANDFITLTTPRDLKQLDSTAALILINFLIHQ